MEEARKKERKKRDRERQKMVREGKKKLIGKGIEAESLLESAEDRELLLIASQSQAVRELDATKRTFASYKAQNDKEKESLLNLLIEEERKSEKKMAELRRKLGLRDNDELTSAYNLLKVFRSPEDGSLLSEYFAKKILRSYEEQSHVRMDKCFPELGERQQRRRRQDFENAIQER